MRLNTTIKWIVSGTFVVFAAGSATAQQQPAAGVGASADAQVTLNRDQQLSPQMQVAQAEEHLGRMDQARTAVRVQLEHSRAARDVVKTLCLNDKLSQIDVAIRAARERHTALQAAALRNDRDLSNHEFTVLTVLRQRSEQLTAEANQCIGEELSFVGKTEIITNVDPTLPGEDQTTYPPTDPTLIGGPPSCVSCSK